MHTCRSDLCEMLAPLTSVEGGRHLSLHPSRSHSHTTCCYVLQTSSTPCRLASTNDLATTMSSEICRLPALHQIDASKHLTYGRDNPSLVWKERGHSTKDIYHSVIWTCQNIITSHFVPNLSSWYTFYTKCDDCTWVLANTCQMGRVKKAIFPGECFR